MGALLAISRGIDAASRYVGLAAIWLVLLAALVSAFNALFRYSIGTILYLDEVAEARADAIAEGRRSL